MPGKYCLKEEIAVIKALNIEGLFNREILERLNRSQRTIDGVVKKLNNKDMITPKKKTGRPRITSKSGEIQSLMNEAGYVISKPTI